MLGVKLIVGRELTDLDIGSENIVLTEKLAKQLFLEQNPLGKVTNQGTVVGVVSDFFHSATLAIHCLQRSTLFL